MSSFDGNAFYNVYKDADFLRVDANVESILSRGYLIRQKIKSLPVGHSLAIEGMQLARNTPLMIKNVGRNVTVEDFEFTYDRLSGLVAAYTYVHRHRYPTIKASEAKALGLEWNNGNEELCRLYLAAVSGTEHMIDQFSYLPLLCGLRKFQLWNIPLETVVSMGLVRSYEGISMAKLLKQNFFAVKRQWMMFPDTTVRELEMLVEETPEFQVEI